MLISPHQVPYVLSGKHSSFLKLWWEYSYFPNTIMYFAAIGTIASLLPIKSDLSYKSLVSNLCGLLKATSTLIPLPDKCWSWENIPVSYLQNVWEYGSGMEKQWAKENATAVQQNVFQGNSLSNCSLNSKPL